MLVNGKIGKIVFSRLLEDEDLAESVKRQAQINGIRAGVFILIGSVKHAVSGITRRESTRPFGWKALWK